MIRRKILTFVFKKYNTNILNNCILKKKTKDDDDVFLFWLGLFNECTKMMILVVIYIIFWFIVGFVWVFDECMKMILKMKKNRREEDEER